MFNFDKKIDSYLITSEVNRFYHTKFCCSNGYLLISANDSIFYTDGRYIASATEALKGKFTVRELDEDYLKQICNDITNMGLKSVGVEDKQLSYSEFMRIKKAFAGTALKQASEEIDALRAIKTEDEIAKIRKAVKLTKAIFVEVIKLLKHGITEKEFRAELIKACLDNGADDMAFSPIVAFSKNTANPHHVSGNLALEKNDIVLIDFGILLNGYRSDFTRTFSIGKPSEKFSRVLDIVQLAQSYVLKNIKAGLSAKEVDLMAREFITANGFEKEFLHGLGHGIGLKVHEAPRLGKTSEDTLKAGMVVTVEPGIYISGEFGARVEDIVVIGEAKSEAL